MNNLFPPAEIPPNGPNEEYRMYAGKTVPWLDFDSQERYAANGGHPTYSSEAISYTLNHLGYRCPDFDAKSDIRIVSIGCSFVLALGLPQQEIYHEIISQRLREHTGRSVVNWNLGSSGASNDYIVRMLYLTLPILQPDIVLVNFTEFSRMDYLTLDGQWIKYGPGNDPRWFDAVGREVHHLLNKLRSPLQEELRAYLHYKAVEYALRDRIWFISFLESDSEARLGAHVSPTHSIGHFEKVDLARDHCHPGGKSHARMAELVWQRILEQKVIDRVLR